MNSSTLVLDRVATRKLAGVLLMLVLAMTTLVGCSKSVSDEVSVQSSSEPDSSGGGKPKPVPTSTITPAPNPTVTPPIPGGDPFAQKCDQARLLARSNLIKDFNGMDLLSRMDRTIQRLTPDEMNRMKAAFTTLGSPASSADQKKAAQADVRSAMKGAFQRDSLTTVGDLFADIRMGSNGSDQTYQGVYVGGAVFAGVSRELRGPNLDILKMNWVPGLNWVTLSLSNYKVARDWKLLDSSGAPKQDLPSGGTSLKVSQYIEQKTLSGNCAGRTEMTAAQQQDFDRLALPSPL